MMDVRTYVRIQLTYYGKSRIAQFVIDAPLYFLNQRGGSQKEHNIM